MWGNNQLTYVSGFPSSLNLSMHTSLVSPNSQTYALNYPAYPSLPLLLEYSRWIKLMAECTAEVLFPYMVYKYALPIHHWTWHYITIANSRVFHLQLLGTHWLTHAYLLTITIVIYLVLSLFLSINHCPSSTYNYLHTYIYCVLTTKSLSYSFISSTGYEPTLMHLKPDACCLNS